MTLALGIGLNTAIFSLDQRSFPARLAVQRTAAARAHVFERARARICSNSPISVPRFQHYRESQTIFDGFARGKSVSAFTLTGLGDAVQVLGGQVTSNYFDVLGVRPIRGRNFLPEEEETADVAMVTENFWRKRMGGDPNVIGRSITLDGVPHTIVGVLPNLPFSWVGPTAEVWTTKPFQIAGIVVRAHHARLRFSARRRAAETGNDGRTGARGDAVARAKLSRALSGQDRQLIGDDAEDVARRCHRKFAAGICHSARGRCVRVADRVQQCREPTAR